MADGPLEGATRLSEEEHDDLIPTHITTREQLNEWEQQNILEAEKWAFARRRSTVMSVAFLKELHRRMFDRTWGWAGKFRTTDTNIGVPRHRIPVALRDACDDAVLWVREQAFPAPEAAARFHHRLVSVHPFPNGNGRHARLTGDVLLYTLGYPRLNWGGDRLRYIDALRAADEADYEPLLHFLGVDDALNE